jgi:hypothetical protein
VKDIAHLTLHAILIGAGATLLTDLWTLVRRRLFGIAAPDFRLVGRWLSYMINGRFHHDSIAAATPRRGEGAIGWTAHYLIGIAFASILPAIWGIEWVRHPTLGPALIVGVGSVAAPFLLMQPAMGAGIAANRTPHPNTARWRSVVMHAVFGLALYAAAWMLNFVEYVNRG